MVPFICMLCLIWEARAAPKRVPIQYPGPLMGGPGVVITLR